MYIKYIYNIWAIYNLTAGLGWMRIDSISIEIYEQVRSWEKCVWKQQICMNGGDSLQKNGIFYWVL